MAYSVTCPGCDAEVRSLKRRPAGTRVKCPECDYRFTTKKPSLLVEDDDPPRAVGKRIPPAAIIAVGAGAFVMVVVVGLGIYLLAGRKAGKGASADLLVHAPADAMMLSGYDLEELDRHPGFKRALGRRKPGDLDEIDRGGIPLGEVSRLLVARTPNNGLAGVVRFKAAPDQAKYLAKSKSGSPYAACVALNGAYRFGYFADPTTLVLAEKEPTIQALAEKGGKERLSADLAAMVKRTSGPVWRATGRVGEGDYARFGQNDGGFNIRVGSSLGSAAWLQANGSTGIVRFEWAFENAGKSTAAGATLKGLFLTERANHDFGREVPGTDSGDIHDIRRGYEAGEVSARHEKLTATLDLPASEALRAVGSVRN